MQSMTSRKQIIMIWKLGFNGMHLESELSVKVNDLREELMDSLECIRLNVQARLDDLDQRMQDHYELHCELVDYYKYLAQTGCASVKQEAIQWLAYCNY
jgi:hypothetical protein